MPGFGVRELKAMICNRVEVPCHVGAPGRIAPTACGDSECIGQRLSNRDLPAGH
jgi:hypothetical protein